MKVPARDFIINSIDSLDRKGASDLKEFLCVSDFFTAPASTAYHLVCQGGLAIHTANVVGTLSNISAAYPHYNIEEDSLIITAVCHDLCKVGMYKTSEEPITAAQTRYLSQLLTQVKLTRPAKVDKQYASVLIDFLKNKYKPGMKLPEYSESYTINDEFPIGHGEKSVIIAMKYIELTEEEATAIRWHMGAFDVNMISPYQKIPYQQAIEKYPLVTMLHIADLEATWLRERV